MVSCVIKIQDVYLIQPTTTLTSQAATVEQKEILAVPFTLQLTTSQHIKDTLETIQGFGAKND